MGIANQKQKRKANKLTLKKTWLKIKNRKLRLIRCVNKKSKLAKLCRIHQPNRVKLRNLAKVQLPKPCNQAATGSKVEKIDFYKTLFYRSKESTRFKSSGFGFRLFGRLWHMKNKLSLLTSIARKFKGVNRFRSSIIASENGFKSSSRLAHIQNPIFRQQTKLLFEKKVENYKFLSSIYVKRFAFERIKQKAAHESIYGFRILRNLPIRGQRTKTNSRSARSYFQKNKIFENLND